MRLATHISVAPASGFNRVARRSGSSRRQGLAAFTLIEMLVAMIIFGMVLTSLYSTWRILMRSNATAVAVASRAQRKRLAIQTVEEALNSSVFFAANATNYTFIADTTGMFADLTFVAHLGNTFPGSGRFDGEKVRRVWFTVEPGPGGGAALMLRQNSMLAPLETMDIAFPIVLARDISAFQLQFWSPQDGGFIPEWTLTNQLPALVQISMAFGNETGTAGTQPDWVTRFVRLPAVGVAGDAQVGPVPTATQ